MVKENVMVRIDHDLRMRALAEELNLSSFLERMLRERLTRTCHDCGHVLHYHEWIELRCTLDNEDTIEVYCKQ